MSSTLIVTVLFIFFSFTSSQCPTSVGSLVIPSFTVEIGDYDYYGCETITSLFIPSTVTKIGIHCYLNFLF